MFITKGDGQRCLFDAGCTSPACSANAADELGKIKFKLPRRRIPHTNGPKKTNPAALRLIYLSLYYY